jgi:Domain of Unknown Function (DUF1259)
LQSPAASPSLKAECRSNPRPPLVWRRVSTSSRPGMVEQRLLGDFVLVDKEVNPVIRALRANGIEVTALHSHMLDEQPRMFLCTSGRTTMPKNSPRASVSTFQTPWPPLPRFVLVPRVSAQTVSRTWTGSRLKDAGSPRCPGARFIDLTRCAIKVQHRKRLARVTTAGDVRYWPKQTWPRALHMSAFWGQSRHHLLQCECPLLTQSGHQPAP